MTGGCRTSKAAGFRPASWDEQLGRTLNLAGRVCMSLTRRHSPMSVAMLQCCTVGVNWTLHGQANSGTQRWSPSAAQYLACQCAPHAASELQQA